MEVYFFINAATGEITAKIVRHHEQGERVEWFTGLSPQNVLNLRENVKATCGEMHLCLGKKIDPAKPFKNDNVKVLQRIDSFVSLNALRLVGS